MEIGFLDAIESIETERASVQRLYEGEGVRVRGLARNTPAYLHKLAEAGKLLGDVIAGRKPTYLLEAALSTSDFPLLFADILDRQVLAAYREWPVVWTAIAQRATVRDFRDVKIYPPAYGADGRLVEVAQLVEYPESTITEQAATTMSVKKYGRRIGFSWEAMINDDLDQLKDIPARFARAARRTEHRAVTDLYVGASGPHATMYSVGNANIVTGNPPLSIAGLTTAMTVLAAMTGENGEPIMLETVTLVVPPALEITARNILNATEIDVTTAGGVRDGGSGEQRLRVANWMRNRLTLVVDPYIPVVASSANGNTSWFLFGNPNDGRPAIRIAFLRGHEEPEVFIKEPGARRAGGGPADPMDGSFENDSVDYKVRHVLGVARIAPKVTVASNGSGS